MLEENALTSIKTLHPGLTVYWDIEEIRRETDDVLLSHEPNMRSFGYPPCHIHPVSLSACEGSIGKGECLYFNTDLISYIRL